MLKNVGTVDRVLRIALGAAILFLVPQSAWAWLGLLPLATGLAGYCPLYHLFGWSTNRVHKRA